ncbi:hypothetical protein MKZ38_001203 [Zalerion maritima]|uniref:Uncharacterized protein n=1 Tax=Zalerion maritima TaxID=339359 RepID=A0AAD5RZ92_9PEZI|nr:hypothetical protein MKZ38_001203 [Zalerion maritima]
MALYEVHERPSKTYPLVKRPSPTFSPSLHLAYLISNILIEMFFNSIMSAFMLQPRRVAKADIPLFWQWLSDLRPATGFVSDILSAATHGADIACD